MERRRVAWENIERCARPAASELYHNGVNVQNHRYVVVASTASNATPPDNEVIPTQNGVR